MSVLTCKLWNRRNPKEIVFEFHGVQNISSPQARVRFLAHKLPFKKPKQAAQTKNVPKSGKSPQVEFWTFDFRP